MVHDVSEALVPVLIGVIIDRAVIPGDLSALLVWLGVLAVLFVALSLSWRIGARILVRNSSRAEHELRLLGVRRVLADRGMRTQRKPGELLSIATSDAERVAELSWVLANQASSIASLVTAAVALLVISVPLGVAILVVSPLLLVVMHVVSRPLESRSHAEQSEAARASALAADVTRGLRVLKGIGGEPAATDRYCGVSRSSLTAALRAARTNAWYRSFGDVLSSLVVAGVVAAAGLLALDGGLTVGAFVTVVGLAQFVQTPMGYLGHLAVELTRRRASSVRLVDLLNEPGAVRSGERLALSRPAAGVAALMVRGLRTGTGTLPGFRLEQGEVLGLVLNPGPATQLVDVLGLRVPCLPGDVQVHGIDLTELDLAAGRRLISSPPHNAALFSGTLAENIAPPPAEPDAVRADVLAATAVDDVLSHLPDGLDSVLPDQGSTLSGGQRQRVTLARTLHGGQPVLVLHEPTSAVDAATEAAIAAGLRQVSGASILLITHSPIVLAHCDRVLRLETVPARPPDDPDDPDERRTSPAGARR